MLLQLLLVLLRVLFLALLLVVVLSRCLSRGSTLILLHTLTDSRYVHITFRRKRTLRDEQQREMDYLLQQQKGNANNNVSNSVSTRTAP